MARAVMAVAAMVVIAAVIIAPAVVAPIVMAVLTPMAIHTVVMVVIFQRFIHNNRKTNGGNHIRCGWGAVNRRAVAAVRVSGLSGKAAFQPRRFGHTIAERLQRHGTVQVIGTRNGGVTVAVQCELKPDMLPRM